MSYYNDILVVFTLNSCPNTIDYRAAGQRLPKNSIPCALVDRHRGMIIEIINDVDKNDIVKLFSDDIKNFNFIAS